MELYEAHANIHITFKTVKEFVIIKPVNYNIRIIFDKEWKFKRNDGTCIIYTLLGINSLKAYGVNRRTIKKYNGEFVPMKVTPYNYIEVPKEKSYIAEFKTEEDTQRFIDEVIMPIVISEKLIINEKGQYNV